MLLHKSVAVFSLCYVKVLSAQMPVVLVVERKIDTELFPSR